MSWTWPQGIAHLRGGGIRLEALSPDHLADLTRAAATATEHEWHLGFVPPPQDMKVYVSRAIAREDGKLRACRPDERRNLRRRRRFQRLGRRMGISKVNHCRATHDPEDALTFAGDEGPRTRRRIWPSSSSVSK